MLGMALLAAGCSATKSSGGGGTPDGGLGGSGGLGGATGGGAGAGATAGSAGSGGDAGPCQGSSCPQEELSKTSFAVNTMFVADQSLIVYGSAGAANTIQTIPVGGGTLSPIAPNLVDPVIPDAPVYDGSDLYFIGEQTGGDAGGECRLYRAPLDGGNAIDYPNALEVGCSEVGYGTGYVFVLNAGKDTADRFVFDPPANKQLATVTQLEPGGGLEVGNLYMFFANQGIYRLGINGGSVDEIVPASELTAYPSRVWAADGDDEIFFTHTSLSLAGSIYSVPATGGTIAAGTVKSILTKNGAAYEQVQVDDTWVYYVDQGVLARIPRAGGDSEVLVQNSCRSYVVDGTTLFWAEGGPNSATLYRRGI
jgi:hypothetical protein